MRIIIFFLLSILCFNFAYSKRSLPIAPSDTNDAHIVILPVRCFTMDSSLIDTIKNADTEAKNDIEKEIDKLKLLIADTFKFNREKKFNKKLSIENLQNQIISLDSLKLNFGLVESVLHYLAQTIQYEIYGIANQNSVIIPNYLNNRQKWDYENFKDSKVFGRFIAYFDSVNISNFTDNYSGDIIKIGKFKYVIYDTLQKKRIYDTTLIQDDKSQGFTYGCSSGNIKCPFLNAFSILSPMTARIVLLNLPKIKYMQEVYLIQREELIEKYLTKELNSKLNNLIPLDSTIPNVKNIVYSACNKDTTKIIAFFQEKADMHNKIKDKNKYDDQNITYLQKDAYNLDTIPQIYACVVVYELYEGKWYFEKPSSVYFDSENYSENQYTFIVNQLIRKDYFNKNDITINNDFWETGYFEKVKKIITKKEDYLSWNDRDLQDYIGITRFIAKELKGDIPKFPRKININNK